MQGVLPEVKSAVRSVPKDPLTPTLPARDTPRSPANQPSACAARLALIEVAEPPDPYTFWERPGARSKPTASLGFQAKEMSTLPVAEISTWGWRVTTRGVSGTRIVSLTESSSEQLKPALASSVNPTVAWPASRK